MNFADFLAARTPAPAARQPPLFSFAEPQSLTFWSAVDFAGEYQALMEKGVPIGIAVKRMSPRPGGAGGSIVNLSSAAAVLGAPNQYVDYAASKGAIDTFTMGLAKEVATEGIRVNGVRPGLILTDIHASGGQPDRAHQLSNQVPMQRPGTADEVAHAVVWLLSDAASYVTASNISVSGGRA